MSESVSMKTCAVRMWHGIVENITEAAPLVVFIVGVAALLVALSK